MKLTGLLFCVCWTVACIAIPAAASEIVLYTFTGGADGGFPRGGLIRDAQGNLYGTTYYGGTAGKGVVFKLDTTGHETVLHSFTGGSDGGYPSASLTRDSTGNLYGTAVIGGARNLGVVYKRWDRPQWVTAGKNIGRAGCIISGRPRAATVETAASVEPSKPVMQAWFRVPCSQQW